MSDQLPQDYAAPDLPEHDPFELSEATIYHLAPELNFPFTTSFGSYKRRDTVLLALKTTDGLVALGEAPTLPDPAFDSEYVYGVIDVLQRFILPMVRDQLGGTLTHYDDFWATFKKIRGHHFAKSSFESAYWQLVMQQLGQPLVGLWGGVQESVPAGFSLGAKTAEEIFQRAAVAIERGFGRIKVKIWPELDVVHVIGTLREKYPDVMLQVDANSAFDPRDPDHQRVLSSLDQFELLLIEQPFRHDDIFDHARFQAEHDLRTPITLDESIKTLEDARTAAEIWRMFGISDRLFLNIKPPRVGGYWQSVLIADLALQEHLECWVGGMLDMTPGKWMNIIFASHPACR
ncbi:partial o-succinylbenzoate synthase, partial [Anaerolineae bacterium]